MPAKVTIFFPVLYNVIDRFILTGDLSELSI